LSGIDGIGDTPVVQLNRLPGDDSAEVWVKLEAANPTGSYKDRMALAMIEGAERDGRLRPGQLVVEYSGGSTGSSLAFVCAVKGYPLRVVSSDAFAAEKLMTMEAFGAEVELIHSPEGITPQLIPAMVRRAREIASETGAFWTDQFNNTDMIDGYRRLGDELLRQLPGPPPITAFCSYVGTAGCFLGTTGMLSSKLPALYRVVVEPGESAVLSGGIAGTHHIEGGGIGSWPPLLRPDDFDEVVTVPEADAFAMARRAAQTEGIFSGPSTGANLVATVQIARRLGPGHRVVTVQVDSGLKYLNGPLFR
jgi:cysteine synthase A